MILWYRASSEVEIVLHAGADGGDHRPDLLVAEDLVDPGPLDVQDLAPERQDGLERAVAALLGAAAGRVALDQVDLAERRVVDRAVGQLARQHDVLQAGLLADQVARLARRLAGPGRADRLLDDVPRHRRMLLEEVAEVLVHHRLDDALDLGVAQLGLGLALELRLLHLDVQHAGEPLADVLAGEGEVFLLEELALLGHVVDGAGQRRLEPGEVGAALVGIDVVHEGEGVLVVAVLVLQGDVHLDVVLGGGERDRLGVQRLLVAVEPLDELDQAALGQERLRLGRLLPLVLDADRHAAVEERELAQPVGQGGVVELEDGEDLGVGLEADDGAGALGLAQHRELLDRLAPDEAHVVPLAVAVDDDLQPLAERVHHRNADAVQAAGHLVAVLVELAAGVEHRQRHLDRRHLLGRVHVHRDAAAVVGPR